MKKKYFLGILMELLYVAGVLLILLMVLGTGHRFKIGIVEQIILVFLVCASAAVIYGPYARWMIKKAGFCLYPRKYL
jgi:hypothetical protein